MRKFFKYKTFKIKILLKFSLAKILPPVFRIQISPIFYRVWKKSSLPQKCSWILNFLLKNNQRNKSEFTTFAYFLNLYTNWSIPHHSLIIYPIRKIFCSVGLDAIQKISLKFLELRFVNRIFIFFKRIFTFWGALGYERCVTELKFPGYMTDIFFEYI